MRHLATRFAAAARLGGCLVVLWPGGPAIAQEAQAALVPDEQSVILERADRARARGAAEAPLRIVEISDFECPFCVRFYEESYQAIDSIYVRSGIARYVWISFPNSAHPRAWPAIEAAFCAGSANRFWEMHDILFERHDQWTGARDPHMLFLEWAAEAGLDRGSFDECMRNDQTAPLQVRDYEAALRAGVASTPFFIVGDSVAIRGAVPLEVFRATVDSVLVRRGIDGP